MATTKLTKAQARDLLISHLFLAVSDGATQFFTSSLVTEDDETTLRDLIIRAFVGKDTELVKAGLAQRAEPSTFAELGAQVFNQR